MRCGGRFAGGADQPHLKYALEVAQGWKVIAKNFFVKNTCDGVSHAAIESPVRELATPKARDSAALRWPMAQVQSHFGQLTP